jgi:uncharacterized protein (DUF924 family)
MEKSTNKKKRSQCLFKEFCHLSFEHSSDLAAAISGGKLFQSLTVLTKNDHFLKSLVADGIAYEWF